MTSSILFLFLTLLVSCFAGDLTISYAPDSLRFGHASALRASALDDLLAVAMGYTPETTPWSGLTVTSPFKLPSTVVVVGIAGSGSSVQQEGTRYPLQEDTTLPKVYSALHAAVSARSQRPTHFVYMEVVDGADDGSSLPALPQNSSLKLSVQPDAAFLIEVATLPELLLKTNTESSVSHGGQDFIFYQIESFAILVKTYGDDSPQVSQAKQLLRAAVSRLSSTARQVYSDRVLVVTAVFDTPAASAEQSARVKRAAQQLFQVKDSELNIAPAYSEDFPAIFNIILFLSIALLLAIIAVSMSMAYMDPGRDSIIYRMTNPRMKKDQ